MTQPRLGALCLATLLACAGPALAGGAHQHAKKSPASARAAAAAHDCARHQDRAACRHEQRSVQRDLRANPRKLDDAGENYAANARARCEPLPGDQKSACLARVAGAGTVVGSVEAGGVYRELVTRDNLEPIMRGADDMPAAAVDTAPSTN
jgi:hypothetical protein